MVSLYNFPDGTPFQVLDAENCVFRHPETKEIFRPRTYAELGAYLIEEWMGSPGHRENLVNPIYSRMGSGIAFDLDNQLCGRIYATQTFAD